jgi:hypothetical protein
MGGQQRQGEAQLQDTGNPITKFVRALQSRVVQLISVSAPEQRQGAAWLEQDDAVQSAVWGLQDKGGWLLSLYIGNVIIIIMLPIKP